MSALHLDDLAKEFCVITEKKVNSLILQLKKDFNDKLKQIRNEMLSMNKFFIDRESYFMPLDGFDEFKAKIDQWIANIQRAFAAQKEAFQQKIQQMIDQNRLELDLAKEQIFARINLESENIREQDITLDHFAVNFEAMKIEIERLKNRSFIIENNIENMYTQIERLKAGR